MEGHDEPAPEQDAEEIDEEAEAGEDEGELLCDDEGSPVKGHNDPVQSLSGAGPDHEETQQITERLEDSQLPDSQPLESPQKVCPHEVISDNETTANKNGDGGGKRVRVPGPPAADQGAAYAG